MPPKKDMPRNKQALFCTADVLQAQWQHEAAGPTGEKAVRPDEASHRASMKSRVAPNVLWRRRGEDGGSDSASRLSRLCNVADPYSEAVQAQR